MKQENNPAEFYNTSIITIEQQLNILYKTRSRIAWLRFIIFIFTCFGVYFLWNVGLSAIIIAVIAGIALFLIAVSKDADNKAVIKNFETLLSINKDEIDYLNHNFYNKYDGKDLQPANHAYAKDLDVFGKASLFQYINRCNAEQAIQLLSQRLLTPLDKENILQQQMAVKEISNKTNWWQQFRTHGIHQKITFDAEQRINKWLALKDEVYTNSGWKLFARIYPVITLSCVYLYLDDVLPSPLFSLLVLVFFLISLTISRKVQSIYLLLSRLEPIVFTLYNQLHYFEKENFNDAFLITLQKQLKSLNSNSASASIKQLQNILSRFDVRLNAFAFILLNTFCLWDLWQVIALNEWKKANKALVPAWFNIIAGVEVIGSLATLNFNNPEWCFPLITNEHFTLSGQAINHPLIPKQQSVANQFNLKGTAKVDLITGSNMAGKSTFLRSIGVNMILAYTGSAVNAKSLEVSVAELMSSMRIEDNLAENTSTFYAELKKLKSIIDAVNTNRNIFILLDEILRGTNSLDRHTGSKALIQQLIRKNAVAIIATHDIELSKLENDFPHAIKNYHFDVAVNNEKLFFDYKLKEGVCTSMNASLLMRQIGIEM